MASSLWAQSGSTGPDVAKTTATAGANKGDKDEKRPYVAQLKATNIQVMPDGRTVTQELLRMRIVDSNGRTMMSESEPLAKDSPQRQTFSVDDPVDGSLITWNSWYRSANMLKLPPPDHREGCWLSDSGRVKFDYRPTHPGTHSVSSDFAGETKIPGAMREDLGTALIQGIEAHGQRWTLTIPAGQIGNAKPVITTAESWFAPALGIEVRHVNDDGQGTRSVMELESIQFIEPPASSFRPPTGYTIATEQMHEMKCPE